MYILYFSCDWVLHFVLFSTAVSCFSRHSVGLPGGLVGGGVWLQSGLVCCILCCTELTVNKIIVHKKKVMHYFISYL